MTKLITHTMELLEELERIKDKYVIVEGKKDIAALKKFGFTQVVEINGPLFSFIEKVAQETKDVVLLTDLDVEGKKLFGTINSGLSHLGVRVDKKLREYLFRHTPLRQIEGIDTFLNK